jgi:hypothetical protein
MQITDDTFSQNPFNFYEDKLQIGKIQIGGNFLAFVQNVLFDIDHWMFIFF